MCKVVDGKATVKCTTPFAKASSEYVVLIGRVARLSSNLRRRHWEPKLSPHQSARDSVWVVGVRRRGS